MTQKHLMSYVNAPFSKKQLTKDKVKNTPSENILSPLWEGP